MNTLSKDVLLTNETGQRLYHKYAKDMPIIDYHTHLSPQEVYENKVFEDLGEMWLAHDHYKWRAMRTFGILEELITGTASFYDKFMAFAEIFPRLIGNPLYLWCSMELEMYFGIDISLCKENGDEIYKATKALIAEKEMTPAWCLAFSKVTMVSTTDDPVDSLEYHEKIRDEMSLSTQVLPAFRPDQAYHCNTIDFPEYLTLLGQAAGLSIQTFAQMMEALEQRLLHFASLGSIISDNGVSNFHWTDYTAEDIDTLFQKAVEGAALLPLEIQQYHSAFLFELGKIYHKHGFVMQIHAGGYGDANTKMTKALGFGAGFGCVDDLTPVTSIGTLLDRLTLCDALPTTILYPLNANQMESYAILAAAFCDESRKAKVQLGAPWWFSDQVYGITRQFEAVANLYPISLSVGMLTDSRSFIAYPRHDVYRRLLCNFFGSLVERGEYFSEEKHLGEIIQNICYGNAKELFGGR